MKRLIHSSRGIGAAPLFVGMLIAGLMSAENSLSAGPIQLLSARVPVTQPAGGNGNSVAPVVSADGRFVLFSSSANNLVVGDNAQLGVDVFLHDGMSNTTVLVSANLSGDGGGNGSSLFGGVSTNGQYVVFESDASDLVTGDTNGVVDIFVRDLVAGTTELISVSTNGTPSNGASSQAVMTPDARYVAFISAATNLVVNDTNRIPDVFVRDRLAQTTVMASVGASSNFLAFMSSPSISPDGRYVTFTSNARGLAPGIPASPIGEVYLRDLVGGTTRWASTNGAEVLSNAWHLLNVPSSHPSLSDDGQFVTFKTGSTNGVGLAVILQYDALNETTTVIATNGYPAPAFTDDLFGPEMSPDGRFVAYAARSLTNQNYSSVYLWDGQNATNIPVSVDQSGLLSSNSISHTPALSPDGSFVVFLSNATNLVGNAVSNGFHLYLRDVLSGTNQLVDVDTNGIGSTDQEGAAPTLSADGRFVAFSSPDGRLVDLDNNNAYDVFLRDTVIGSTELISRRDAGVIPQTGSGLSSSTSLSLSADGRWAVFSSMANDLVPNDTNDSSDVFVRDLALGANYLVSAGTNGSPALGGFSGAAVISANGRFVAFVSSATNLVASPTYASTFQNRNNIYLRDLLAKTNVMVSVNGVNAGNNDSWAPVVSQDGRYVTFGTWANNLGGMHVIRRDVTAGTNLFLSDSDSVWPTMPPSMSLDGRYVAYVKYVSEAVRVRDALYSTNVYDGFDAVNSFALSPTGNRLLLQIGNYSRIVAVDLATRSNLVSFSTKQVIQTPEPWSTNGRFFTFVTASNAVAGDSNGTNDVYVYDLLANTLTLASAKSNHLSSANGPSDSPVMSGDGRFVVYRSFATDLVPGITNTPPNIFIFDRITGSNAVLSLAKPISSWTPWVSRPAIDSVGASVLFDNWKPDLAPPDLNGGSDVFAFLPDSDSDGIPDVWIMQYFGHPTGQAGDLSRAQDDADQDGMTNLEEYLAGTNPVDAASALRIQVSFVTGANGVVLTWPAAAARTYHVQYKDNLTDLVWLDAPGTVSVNGSQAQFSALADQPGRFYRVIANQ